MRYLGFLILYKSLRNCKGSDLPIWCLFWVSAGPSRKRRNIDFTGQPPSDSESLWSDFDEWLGEGKTVCNNQPQDHSKAQIGTTASANHDPASAASDHVGNSTADASTHVVSVNTCDEFSDFHSWDFDGEFGFGGSTASCSSLPHSPSGFRSADMLRLHRDTTRDLVDLGGPTSHCEHCGAIFWYGERLKRGGRGTVAKFSLCCGHSKVKLPYLRDSPHLLDQLMDYNGDHRAKNFRANIRPANCLFNFTSFGANIDKSVTNRPGPFCYRIYGETYHCIGSLLPSEGEAPKFAQLYVVDTENEVKNRMAAVNTEESSKPLDEQVVADLKNMFDVESKLVDVFRRARDAFHADPDFKFKIKLVAPFKKDGSQYATGECPEVVGLIVGEQDQLAVGFEIIVQYKGGKLKHIDMLHPSYMPLQYPILFPYGEDGYHLHMKLNPEWLANQPATTRKKRNRISPAEYYRFRLQQRLFETTRLLKGGKLLHQFIVDAYTCVEQNRLSFHEFNQHLLRSELYQGLADAFSRGDTDLEKLGKRIV